MTRSFVRPHATPEGNWRAIILFGRNVASYKFALGKSLMELAGLERTEVRLEELAVPFARNLCEHVAGVDRQGTSPQSRFLDACRAFNRGEINQGALADRTVELGFVAVIDAFHMVNGAPTPIPFYVDERRAGGGIRLTDELLALATGPHADNLPHEVEARWRLVETAWELSLPRHVVTVAYEPASEILVVEDGHVHRRRVTACRPALNGYQHGLCFYCDRPLEIAPGDNQVDVDHFLPWSLMAAGVRLNLDGVWNLVLACRDCNRGPSGKMARVPTTRFLHALHARNEYLIASHHPLRETLILSTGASEPARAAFLRSAYGDADRLLLHPWEPPS